MIVLIKESGLTVLLWYILGFNTLETFNTLRGREGWLVYDLDYKIGKEYNKILEVISSGYITYLNTNRVRKIRGNNLLSARQAVMCFILNSSRCKGTKFNITLDKSNYDHSYILNGKSTGRKVSYRYTRELVSYLYQEDYIDLSIGGVTEWGYDYKLGVRTILNKECSYIILRPTLKGLLDSVVPISDNYRTNVLFLRDSEGDLISFKANPESTTKREYLQGFNQYSLSRVVRGADGTKYSVEMYKVYNINIFTGARSYMNGSVQALSKKERSELTIDNKVTVGYDYGSFDPSLAYCMNNLVMEVDPYQIKLTGYDEDLLRGISKKALLIMLNCDSIQGGHLALNKVISDDYDVKALFNAGKIPYDYIQTKKVMKLLELHNHPISNIFYNSKGGDLQYMGSLINDYVVEYMMQHYDCLAVSVFDEFIVDQDYEEEIQAVMKRAYEIVTSIPENCKITKEF